MKRFAVFGALALALVLTGCAGKSVLEGGTSVTATIQNPVGVTEQYEVEAAVAAVRRVGLAAIRTRQCRRSETASVSNICVKRAVKAEIQSADDKATKALGVFRRFVDNNQTISAISAAKAVMTAVAEYKNTLFINGVQ